MVAHKVPCGALPWARLGKQLVGHGNGVPGVVEIQQHHVEHQRCLPRDVTTWRGGGWDEGRGVGGERGGGGGGGEGRGRR